MSNTEPLRELAREVLRVQGWSTYTLQERVAGTPYARSKSWFAQRIAERQRATPLRPDDVEAFALALGKPARAIRAADLAGHRLMEATRAEAWLLMSDVEALSERQKAAVLAVVESMKEPTDAAPIAPEDPEVEALHDEARAEMAEERHLRSAPKGPSRDVRPRA